MSFLLLIAVGLLSFAKKQTFLTTLRDNPYRMLQLRDIFWETIVKLSQRFGEELFKHTIHNDIQKIFILIINAI